MKFQIEIYPQNVEFLDGPWITDVPTLDDPGEMISIVNEDITYAIETIEERLNLLVELYYPGVEEYYR